MSGVERFDLCIFGFRSGSQNTIRKTNSMGLHIISFVKTSRFPDVGAYRDNTKEGDKLLYGGLLRFSSIGNEIV
jgi:hypothetical protein